MMRLLVHTLVSRHKKTPGGSKAGMAASSASGVSRALASKTCGRRACTSGSSHTNAASDLMARVASRGTGWVNERGAWRASRAGLVKRPSRASWKQPMPASSKLMSRRGRSGGALSCKEFAQRQTAAA